MDLFVWTLTCAMRPFLTDSPAVPEEDEDHSEDNESSPYVSEKVSDSDRFIPQSRAQ